jgi:SRSO17 transposase
VKTTESKAAAAARIGAALGRRKRAELLELLRPCFARVEPWLQAGKYAAALTSDLPRGNGWTLAERAGDRAPDRMQRLLSRAAWDAAAVIRAVRRFAVAGLDHAARGGGRRGLAVGTIDETSQVKQGERTAGVKRRYLGCAGKVANGITTVHLADAREGIGHALIAARQWIPREQLEDPARRRVMRLPPDLALRTKGQLAIDLIGEVLAGGIGLDFACGDEVYGRCTQLREYLEARGLASVLRVPPEFSLTAARGVRLTCKQAAATLLAARRGWEVRSAGTGAKGQRWYAWAWLGTASPQHSLLIGRHLTSGELAFHYCFVRAGQPVSLTRLVRAAGCRWPAEEDFRSGKGCFGPDESQVRLFTAIARHTALVMAALAICAVTAALLRRRTGTRAPAPVRPDQPPPADPGLIPLTVPETAGLLAHPPPPGASRHWLAWRRRRQALSAWYRQRTRLARDEHVLLVSWRLASTAAAISS